MKPVIAVSGLRKSYGALTVVKDLSLTINQGEIFAILGPNGAGKTTTGEILEGFRVADSGSISVLDTDPAIKGAAALAWRNRIGIVLQSTQDTAELTVREALTHFASYYSNPRGVDEVITLVGLQEKADDRART
jgi:ABC-2 type transport system ATP-binding protein